MEFFLEDGIDDEEAAFLLESEPMKQEKNNSKWKEDNTASILLGDLVDSHTSMYSFDSVHWYALLWTFFALFESLTSDQLLRL